MNFLMRWLIAASVLTVSIPVCADDTQPTAGAPFCVMAQRLKISMERMQSIMASPGIAPEIKKFYLEKYYEQMTPPPAYCQYQDSGSCRLAAGAVGGVCVENPNR